MLSANRGGCHDALELELVLSSILSVALLLMSLELCGIGKDELSEEDAYRACLLCLNVLLCGSKAIVYASMRAAQAEILESLHSLESFLHFDGLSGRRMAFAISALFGLVSNSFLALHAPAPESLTVLGFQVLVILLLALLPERSLESSDPVNAAAAATSNGSTSRPPTWSELVARSYDYEPDQASQGDMCIICLESFAEGDRIADCFCSHKYHEHCLQRWSVERQGGCPLRCHAPKPDEPATSEPQLRCGRMEMEWSALAMMAFHSDPLLSLLLSR